MPFSDDLGHALPEQKRCPKCREVKPRSCFYVCKGNERQKPYLASRCKPCNRIEVYERTKEVRERITQIKVEKGCVDCGYNAHPAALHFDHLPGFVKKFHLSNVSTASWSAVEAEIAKCEVVCANCHAVRTAERRADALLG